MFARRVETRQLPIDEFPIQSDFSENIGYDQMTFKTRDFELVVRAIERPYFPLAGACPGGLRSPSAPVRAPAADKIRRLDSGVQSRGVTELWI